MAEFDFAPRPPKQTDQDGGYSPFGTRDGDPNQGAKPDATPARQSGPGAGGGNSRANRAAARRNPSEASGMLAGLMSMATTMGFARHTNAHVDPISSPTGLMGLVRQAFGAKHQQSDEHKFDLDVSRHASPGGSIGGTQTGLGMVGGPVQAMARKEATGAAMKALGGMARSMGGGLAATLGAAGNQAREHMHWLSDGVKKLYKVER